MKERAEAGYWALLAMVAAAMEEFTNELRRVRHALAKVEKDRERLARLHEEATENAARYSAVIEKAAHGSECIWWRMAVTAECTCWKSTVDVSTVLRERDAAKWDEGWSAAQVVMELEGEKVWAHTVIAEGYEPNPYRVNGEPT